MADSPSTSSSTSSMLKQTFTSHLPLMTWLAIAVVFLVAITISGDSDPVSSTAENPTTVIGTASDEPDGDAADDDSAGSSSDEASSSGSAGGDTSGGTADGDDDSEVPANDSGGDDPATTDPDGEGSAAPPPSTITVTLPTTTVAGATPPATTVAGASPQPTTTAVSPPPTTIVVTAAPTTIRVTLPPTTTTVPPSVTEGCSLLGTDEFGDIEIELTVVSPTAAVAQLEIGFELTDVAGEVFLPEFHVVEYVAPGEVLRLALLTFEPIPPGNDLGSVNCTITGVDAIDLFPDQRLPGPADTCSVIGIDEIGDIQLDVTVQNPDQEPADLVFTYAVRDEQGVRVISDVGFADGLDPGATSTQQIDTLLPPPAGVDPATLTCDIVGLELF